MNEERSGTPQYTSTVHTTGLGKAEELFVETSSYPQQTTLEDTIDSLAKRTLAWFERGWQSKGCR